MSPISKDVLLYLPLKFYNMYRKPLYGRKKLAPDKKIRYWGTDIDSYLAQEGLA